MITLHSQSLTLSRRDSALNPAKTAEWTAPILAQARNAAAACHVIGRLRSASVTKSHSTARRQHQTKSRHEYPLNGHIIAFLDSPFFEHIRQPACLPHELCKRDLTGLGRLVRFIDDRCLLGVGIEMSVETVVGGIECSFRAGCQYAAFMMTCKPSVAVLLLDHRWIIYDRVNLRRSYSRASSDFAPADLRLSWVVPGVPRVTTLILSSTP
jgi:hypothetical protein